MMRTMRHIGVTIVAVMLAILAACGNDETPSTGGTTSPSPTPTQTTFDEAEWTITTPVGWTQEDITSTADAKKAIRYKGANGDYFVVALDPTGSDFSADAVWRYDVKGSAFEIVEMSDCKGGPNQQCSTNDTRYDGWILWKSGAGDPPKVGGHTWYFIFGNTTRTSIDVGTFEQIVESIRVKS